MARDQNKMSWNLALSFFIFLTMFILSFANTAMLIRDESGFLPFVTDSHDLIVSFTLLLCFGVLWTINGIILTRRGEELGLQESRTLRFVVNNPNVSGYRIARKLRMSLLESLNILDWLINKDLIEKREGKPTKKTIYVPTTKGQILAREEESCSRELSV